MEVDVYTISLDSGSGTDATGYTDRAVQGEILAIEYEEDATNPFDTGGDLSITGEESGFEILSHANFPSSSFKVCPLIPAVESADGTTAITDREQKVPVAKERIKIEVTSLGNDEVGVFKIFVGG